jgi:hypothetical protein
MVCCFVSHYGAERQHPAYSGAYLGFGFISRCGLPLADISGGFSV